MKRIFLSLIVIFFLSVQSCNNTTGTDNDTVSNEENTSEDIEDTSEDTENSSEIEEETEPQLLNRIKLSSKGGVKVYRAAIGFEDGTLVPKSNKVKPGQKVKLMINIEDGWKEKNGVVSLGAAEKAETSTGKVLLDAEDLFANRPEISADDAKIITLSITLPKLEEQYDFFKISFRVWDKNGKGEIKGSYKLYMEE